MKAAKERAFSRKVWEAMWIPLSPPPHNISANTAKSGRPNSFNTENRHISFYCTWQILCFIQTEGGGNTVLSKSLGTNFSIAFAHFVFVPPFGNSSSISSFIIIILLWWSVTSCHHCYYCNYIGVTQTMPIQGNKQMIHIVCSDCCMDQPLPIARSLSSSLPAL